MKFRNSIEIKEPADFNLVCDDILSEFLQSYTVEAGLKRVPNELDLEEWGEVDVSYIFTQKGMGLYDTYCKRLYLLGCKLFPDRENDLEISASYMVEL